MGDNEYDSFEIPLSYNEWLAKTKSKKLPSPAGRTAVSTRKHNYEKSMSNMRDIENYMFRWEFVFPEYQFDWTLNFEFNFLINLNLNFDLVLDPDVVNQIAQLYLDYGFEFEKVEKGYYGISRFGRAYFDPPDITPNDLISIAKEIRKKFLNDIGYEYRFSNETMNKIIESLSTILDKHNISPIFVRYMINKILIAESRLRYNSFVNFAVVDYSIVLTPTGGSTGIAIMGLRSPDTFKEELFSECNTPFDTVVEMAIVNISHVNLDRELLYTEYGAEKNELMLPESLVNELSENIDKGRLYLGAVDILVGNQKISYLPARHRQLYNKDKIALRGGIHQAKMQNVINKVKAILDEEGIAGVERLNYISFANELLYLNHKGVRKAKQWKRSISADELIEKYISLGAKEDTLWRVIKICLGK